MSKSIARPYAKALFAIAQQQKKLDVWGKWLRLTSEVASDKIMLPVLTNPRILAKDKVSAIADIVKASAKQDEEHKVAPKEYEDFLFAVIKNNRGILLSLIFDIFTDLVRSSRGESIAKIEVAYKLNETEETELLASLGTYFSEKLIPEFSIKKELVAGFRATVNGKLIEVSLTDRLKRLNKSLKSSHI